jgi:hypothetical protein
MARVLLLRARRLALKNGSSQPIRRQVALGFSVAIDGDLRASHPPSRAVATGPKTQERWITHVSYVQIAVQQWCSGTLIGKRRLPPRFTAF